MIADAYLDHETGSAPTIDQLHELWEVFNKKGKIVLEAPDKWKLVSSIFKIENLN